MDLDHHSAARIAQAYFRASAPPTRLGWGISGYVYLSPDLRTAVKIHRRQEGFDRELQVYRKLRRLRITQLHGLTVPKLRDHQREIKLLRMDFVSPPYLLDFAGASFHPPDFPQDTMDQWHAGIEEMFGPNSPIIYAVYHTLAKHGIHYLDFRPSNINLIGLPGYQPMDANDSGQD